MSRSPLFGTDACPVNLVIRPEKIGDLVAATPTLRAFKQRWPDEPLHVVTDTVTGDLLKHDPHVDRIVAVPWTGRRRGEHAPWNDIYRMLSGRVYKRAAILDPNIDGWNFICARLRVEHVAQAGFTASSLLFGHRRVGGRGDGGPSHCADRYLRVARLLGVGASDGMPRLYVTAAETAQVKVVFPDVMAIRPLVLVHPVGMTTRFNFSVDAYKRLARLISEMTGVPVFFVGTPPQRELLGVIDPRHASCRLMQEGLSLRSLIGVMNEANVVIGGSSGVIHAAAALGVPTIGLYCSSKHEDVVWGPRGTATTCLTVSPRFCPRLARGVLDCNDVSFCDISFAISDARILQAVESSLSMPARGRDPAQVRE